MAFTCKLCDAKCSGDYVSTYSEIIAYGQTTAKHSVYYCSEECQMKYDRDSDIIDFNNNLDLVNEIIEKLEPMVGAGLRAGKDVSEIVAVIRSQKTYAKLLKSVMTREMTNAEIMTGAFNARDLLNTASEKVLEGSNNEGMYDDLIQTIAMMTEVVEGRWSHWSCD